LAISVAQLNTHLEAARTAIAAADYDTAHTQAMAAQACLAGLPDGGQAGNTVEWRATIDGLLDRIGVARRRAASTDATTGGIRRTRIDYTRPTT